MEQEELSKGGKRRRSLKQFGFLMGAFALAGCAPISESNKTGPDGVMVISTPPPENKKYYLDSNFEPGAAFLSAATRYNPQAIAFIKDPIQRHIFTSVLVENQRVTNGGFAARQAEAIASGNAIGISICSDSRVCLGGAFPNLINGKGLAVPVSRIGSQPSIFQPGINHSFFIPHQAAECLPGGCGALGGVEALVKDIDGIKQLQHHGVSDMTIKDIQNLIKMGAGQTTSEAETIEKAWAKVGGRMQAEINAQAHFEATGIRTTHYTAYGIYGHTDDSFQAIEVIDNLGYTHSIKDLPLLNSYSEYLKQQHAIIEALKTQSPNIITINASRNFSSKSLLGNYAEQPGVVFKSEADRLVGKALSVEEARSIVSGGDYGVGALKNGKFLLLTADNAQDMTTLRNMVLTEGMNDGSIMKFLENGGMIAEMTPDKAGQFTGTANILTREMLEGDLKMIDLLKSGKIGEKALLTDDIFSRGMLQQTVRDYKLGIISEEQFLRAQTIIKAIRPYAQILKYGFQFIGDYLMIKDFHTWMTEVVLDENLEFTAPSTQNENVIWVKNLPILITAEQKRIMDDNYGAHPYLVGGFLDHIVVKRNDLAKAHRGAATAFIKHGVGGQEGEVEPWNKMEYKDVGKVVKLEILPPYGPADGKPLILTTTLVSKPNDVNFDGVDIFYDDQNGAQLMMLVDQMTGKPILGGIEGQKTIIPAFDQNNPNVAYLLEVSSVPEKDCFEFRFVGIVPRI